MEEISPPLRFKTTVSRAGTTLHLNCVSEDAVASVEGATITTGDGDVGVDLTEESFRGLGTSSGSSSRTGNSTE